MLSTSHHRYLQRLLLALSNQCKDASVLGKEVNCLLALDWLAWLEKQTGGVGSHCVVVLRPVLFSLCGGFDACSRHSPAPETTMLVLQSQSSGFQLMTSLQIHLMCDFFFSWVDVNQCLFAPDRVPWHTKEMIPSKSSLENQWTIGVSEVSKAD